MQNIRLKYNVLGIYTRNMIFYILVLRYCDYFQMNNKSLQIKNSPVHNFSLICFKIFISSKTIFQLFFNGITYDSASKIKFIIKLIAKIF